MPDVTREAPVLPGTIMTYDTAVRESRAIPDELRSYVGRKMAVRSVIFTSEGWFVTFWDARTLVGGHITYPEFDVAMFTPIPGMSPRLGSYTATAIVHR